MVAITAETVAVAADRLQGDGTNPVTTQVVKHGYFQVSKS